MNLSKKKKIALFASASILVLGGIVTGTVFIVKGIIENGVEYNVNFNGYECKLVGDKKVKTGKKYKAYIASSSGDRVVSVASVTMKDKDVNYTFNNGELTINEGANGEITINAYSSNPSAVYAFPRYSLDSENKAIVNGIDATDLSSVTDVIIPSKVYDEETNTEHEVKEIKEGALNGLSKVKNLTIPFVGSSNNQSHSQQDKDKFFGYIFGSNTFEGVRTLTWQQTVLEPTTEDQYYAAAIPSSLETVNVLGGKYNAECAFSNCMSIKNINLETVTNEENKISDGYFINCISLENVTYPNEITEVGDSCFCNCISLANANFDYFTKINENAFYDCASLQKVELPNSGVTIGDNAFAGMLTGVILCKFEEKSGYENWIGQGSTTPVIFNCQTTKSSTDNRYKFIPCGKGGNNEAYVFEYGGGDYKTKVTIPYKLSSDGNDYKVKYLSPMTFNEFSSIKEIEFEKGDDGKHELSFIGAYCFEGCKSLTNINLCDTKVKTLGTGVFANCYNLLIDDNANSKFLPDLDNEKIVIGNECFYDCHHILNFDASNVSRIGDYGFAYCCFNYIDSKTGERIFSPTDEKGNPACLKRITLDGGNFAYIGKGAFMNACELTAVSVLHPESVKEAFNNIPSYCFYNTKIGSQVGFQVSPTLESIGDYAFAYCSVLSKLDFTYATKVKSIGEGAFYSCGNVKGDITLPETLNSIGSYAFEECVSLTSLNIKSTSITTIPFDLCFDCESLTSVSFAGNIEEIEDFAFGGCKSLNVFNNSSNPEFSNALHTLGNYCFANCSSLKSIKIGASNKGLLSGINMGSNVFAGWTSNQTIYLKQDLFDYYKKAEKVTTKFGWQMTNKKVLFITTHNYTCAQSGSDKVTITVD